MTTRTVYLAHRTSLTAHLFKYCSHLSTNRHPLSRTYIEREAEVLPNGKQVRLEAIVIGGRLWLNRQPYICTRCLKQAQTENKAGRRYVRRPANAGQS